MNIEELNRILAKIQDSGCLDHEEMQRQEGMLHGWQALLEIDQLDRQWEADLKQHVYRVAKLGKPHVPTISDTVAYGVFGILSFALGVFFVVQTNAGVAPSPLGYWTAVGGFVVACVLFFWTVTSFQSGKKYRPLLQAYSTARSLQLQQLAAAQRPGARICLKCLQCTE
ncbi:hypothetical protein [Prosthecobacter sp.]|uniref:hypothetical protein n=1 Tax=Prosthecobacter sp. TaxID=1965333 RepID=UPI0037830925